MNVLLLIAELLLLISAYMSITFFVSRKINNSGIVDVAWAFGFIPAALFYGGAQAGVQPRGTVILLMTALWSMRLTWHLTLRFKRWYPHEDPRYIQLKETLGSNPQMKMYLIFLWQGAILTLMTAPCAVAVLAPVSDISLYQITGIALWTIALIGESVADAQLSQFSREPKNKGHTCQTGLWRYSRHPNYFFEWLGTVAYFVYVLDCPYGWCTVLCPLIMLHILMNVTGVKPAEEHSLRTRSDYAEYAKSTSPFFPWWRKRSHDDRR